MAFPIVAALGVVGAIAGLIGQKKQAKAAKNIAKQNAAAAKATADAEKAKADAAAAAAKAKAGNGAAPVAFDPSAIIPIMLVGGVIIIAVTVLKR